MKIKTVDYAGAVVHPDGPAPGTLPQVAFSGRSNVGKSSLINRVLGRHRRRLARVSATPGKTQQINFYQVRAECSDGAEREFFLVDLPGYGFARVPEQVRRAWRPLIESYLSAGERLVGVVQLVDARHEPTVDDRQMVEFLATLGLPVLIVLTKMDKVRPAARAAAAGRAVAGLGVAAEQVVPFSARTGAGQEELLAALESLLTEVDP